MQESTQDRAVAQGSSQPRFDLQLEVKAPTALPPVSGRMVLLALGAFLVGSVVPAGLVLLTLWLLGSLDPVITVIVAAVLAASIGACGCLALLAWHLGWGWRQLGFSPATRSLWHLLWEIPLSFLVIIISVGAVALVLASDPGGGTRNADYGAALAAGPLTLVPLVLISVLVVPAAEEVVFRRFLLDWLCTRVPAAAAVGLSAVAFALVHVAPPVMLYVGMLGVCAAVLRLWHGTLYAPLALHAVNNGLVVLVAIAGLSG